MSRQTDVIPHLHVAAGILEDADGRVLIAERLGDGPFHGMWEFPGGKIGSGESADEALLRELQEEIGITVSAAECFQSLDHSYPDRRVSIDFFLVSRWEGDPRSCEGQRLRWLFANELESANLLPADAPVITRLRQRQDRRRPA
ncbi:MAG: 8-oxo-dGTP diphosphatase MutT [Pseudomonadota bacterium]